MLADSLAERRQLERLVESARVGQSRAAVLVGEPGIGKTALLEYAVSLADDFRVVRVAGVDPEEELTFAALHQLCAPMLGGLNRLPEPQRDALATAFGLKPGSAPDKFHVGMAALVLLSEAAAGRPLLCVIDDAQWLDRASAHAIAFVARRLSAESIAMLIGTREPLEEFDRLENIVISGLDNEAARELQASVARGPMDERIRERILSESRGNPLALLELPRGLAPAELAGGFAFADALPVSDRVQEGFLRRLKSASREAQLVLLIAAAEPVGDPVLVWRAADRLGLFETAIAAAAAFLERAAALTRDPARRARRTLEAARANFQAGLFDAALDLLVAIDTARLDELGIAQVDLLRAETAFASGRGALRL